MPKLSAAQVRVARWYLDPAHRAYVSDDGRCFRECDVAHESVFPFTLQRLFCEARRRAALAEAEREESARCP